MTISGASLSPSDMLRIGSLFSGIGGLELGLERSGVGRTVWQVERDAYCRTVLTRHWPSAERFDDVCAVGAATLAPVDIICGGFPCQDVSSAGKGAGLSGVRSGLWFEFARIIGELQPEWVVVENVTSGASRWVDQVSEHLGQLGYAVLPVPLSAADVGAPHERARVFLVCRRVVGNPNSHGEPIGPIDEKVAELPVLATDSPPWTTAPEFRGVDDGVSVRLDVARNRALGNAVVPQCAEVVGWIIRELLQK